MTLSSEVHHFHYFLQRTNSAIKFGIHIRLEMVGTTLFASSLASNPQWYGCHAPLLNGSSYLMSFLPRTTKIPICGS